MLGKVIKSTTTTFWAAFFLLISSTAAVNLKIKNNCPFPIWPGIQGSTLPDGGGFRLDGGQSRTVVVPSGWSAGRVWGRRGCDGNFNCDTGFCGNKEQCEGRGGEPPVSLAEFTLNGHGNQDYYDVSLVDGYNLPVFIEPIPGTFRTTGGQYDCKKAGGCTADLSDQSICPPELQKKVNGRSVGCKSACMAFNTDQYCCRGAYGTPDKCPPTNYSQLFKRACPTAYSYAYDDKTSTFFCRGVNGGSADYLIQFC